MTNNIKRKHSSINNKVHDYIKPMLATLVDKPFDDDKYIYEIKWDGYRAIAEWDNKQLKLYSRNGLSFVDKFPPIAHAIQELKQDVILDGEIVLLNKNGHPDFQNLQRFDEFNDKKLVYYVFDLLALQKKDIKHLTLLQRRELLSDLLESNNNDTIRFSDHISGDGKKLFDEIVSKNLEGIIAKKADSLYKEGIRSKEWLKIKNIQSREAIIAGYTQPRNSRMHFGALILAQYVNDELTYMGHTGTGFDDKTLHKLWKLLQPLVVSQSPFKKKVKVNMPVTWVKPYLVCQVSYTEETKDGLLRHPVYMGLRTDKTQNEVISENEQATIMIKQKQDNSTTDGNAIIVGNKKLQVTNLSKIFWPNEGYTKGDVIDYYNKISPYILPYLKNRPISLKRNPNGITDDGFFQKDAGENAPDWVSKIEIYSSSASKNINYIICNNAATLVYLANLGCIEMNPWFSVSKKLDYPDYMVIDIDPSDKNTFDEVVDTALTVQSVLSACGVKSYCKTSGSTGLHVFVPMGRKYNYEQVKNFAHIVATLVNEQMPDNTTLVRSLSKRATNKIYIDYLQNRRGQTLASAYSLRPKPGAPVSTPLEWKEVKHGLNPLIFNINTIFKRLNKKGDLFAPVLQKGIQLEKCINKLSD